MILNRIYLILLSVILSPTPSLADSQCAALFSEYRLSISKGAEVEWQPVRSDIERQDVDPLFELRLFAFSREVTDFNRMKLGELFSLYGRDSETHQWKEHLIPKVITQNPKFQKLLNPNIPPPPKAMETRPEDRTENDRRDIEDWERINQERVLPFQVEQRGKNFYVAHFSELRGSALIQTLRFLFDLAGPDSEFLSLQKRPEAWSDKQTPADLQIPNRVVIEQRNGKSKGLEFPMAEGVFSDGEIKTYIKNLWMRLGLFDEGETTMIEEAANATKIHLHWLPDIEAAPANLKKGFYSSLKGLFGDLNDSGLIKDYSTFANKVVKSIRGSAEPEREILASFHQFLKAFKQRPIQNLSRSSYRRLEVTEKGIYEKNRRMRETDMDPNFSDNLKLLRYGLRGIYGQKILPINTPVPKVGIEFRNEGSYVNTTAKANKVEARLYLYSEGERGIENNLSELRKLATLYGIDPRLFSTLKESIKTGFEEVRKSSWGIDSTLATLVLPITPWENHPLYTVGLKNLAPHQQLKVKKAFSKARAQYVININHLIQVFYGEKSTSEFMNLQINREGELFQLILFGELIRFLSESELATVMEKGFN